MLCVSSRDRLWAAACSDTGPVAGWPEPVWPEPVWSASPWLAATSPVAVWTGDVAVEAGLVLVCPAGERTRINATTAPAATATRTMAAAAIHRGWPSRGGPPRPGGPGGRYCGGKAGGWTRSGIPHRGQDGWPGWACRPHLAQKSMAQNPPSTMAESRHRAGVPVAGSYGRCPRGLARFDTAPTGVKWRSGAPHDRLVEVGA